MIMKRDLERRKGLGFRNLLLVILLFAAPISVAAQAPWTDLTPSATDETAFGSVVGPNASADEVLADGSWVMVDVVNDTDCDVQLNWADKSDVKTIVPAGTSITINAGSVGGYIGSSAELAYMSGETCASGSVYVQGFK